MRIGRQERGRPAGLDRALGVLALALALLGPLAPSASASVAHRFLSQLTAPSPPGLTEPAGIAVDQKTGEVFIADETNGVGVEVFDAAGQYLTHLVTTAESGTGAATHVAVDETTGFVYATVSGGSGDELDVFKPIEGHEYELVAQWSGAATPAGRFATLMGVAVDNSASSSAGDVYLVDEGFIRTFKPNPVGPEDAKEGELVSRSFLGFEEPTAIAVNPTEGDVYVGDSAQGAVLVYPPTGGKALLKMKGKGSPTGGGLGSEPGGNETEITAVAVTPSGEVYVAAPEIGVVDQLNAAGEWAGWITSGAAGVPLTDPVGVGVAPTGNVYISDFGRALDVYAAGVTGPFVKTKEVKEVQRLSAILAGQITPHGASPTSYYFEYGDAAAEGFSHRTPPVEVGTADTKLNVTAEITGLTVGSGYRYRLVGEAEGVAFYGQNAEFETLDAVEGVETKPASGVTYTEAALNGSLFNVDPNLESEGVHYYFQYGETNGYGNTIPAPPGEDIGIGEEKFEVSKPIGGLQPSTLYHFRLVGVNSFGTTFGPDRVFLTHGPPQITAEPAIANGRTEETLKDGLNPGGEETKYYFEYGEAPPTGSSARTPEGAIPANGGPTVEATIGGLKLGTTYHYRLVAFHESEEGSPVVGPDQTFTTALIESESATSITDSGAKIEAVLNPQGADVKYRFEYGTSASYGTIVPIPDGDLGAAEPATPVSASLTGLLASTVYHYRIVATVGAETALGADRTFTTSSAEPGPPLPDGRAYEMVTPADKHGALLDAIQSTWGFTQASTTGDAITYPSDGAITEAAEGNREPEPSQNLSTRSTSDWSTQDLATPHDRAVGLFQTFAEYRQFSPDLALSIVEPNPYGKAALAEPPLSPPVTPGEVQEKTIYARADTPIAPAPGEESIYRQAEANGAQLSGERGETLPGYLALLTAANTAPGTKIGGILPPQTEKEKPPFIQGHVFVTATPDLSHAVLRSLLEPFTTESSDPGLYEWSAGQLKLISILPDGTPAPDPGLEGPGIRLGQGSERLGENFRHALSSDGSRAVWSALHGPNEKAAALYLRDMVKGRTVRLDLVQGGPPLKEGTLGEAQFQIASADGSRVFFTDPQRLTADSKAIAGLPDLYECEIVEVAAEPTCRLADLTVDHNAGESAGVRGEVLGASEDGSNVYFVAGGVLTSIPNGNGDSAAPFANNLYVVHDNGSTRTTTFIATLGTPDRNDFVNRSSNKPNAISELTSRVSPNGNYLAFMSSGRLTGYDNTDAVAGTPDQEVFMYDAGANSLLCASCNPSGARPRGVLDQKVTSEGSGLLVDRAVAWEGQYLAGNIPTSNPDNEFVTQHQPRYLLDNGRLFFNSPSDLVPAAKNGKENVYEYQRNGTGSCASANGCIALISSGDSTHESAFLDASESGDAAFFLTVSSLASRDTDESFDIYDARVCTAASACLDQSTTPPPVACESVESCRPVPPSAVTFAEPSTTVTSISGNLKPSNAVLPSTTAKPPVKALTRKQKLAKALKACHRGPKKKRKKCEAHAKKRYGAKQASRKGGR
jgi:DNA-binding beta-propeller fold protein YncE